MDASAAPVSTRGLTKSFGERTVLSDLDLELRAGEVLGYLGPNGAGKTTTMRLLLGALSPTCGTSTLFGVPSSDPLSRVPVGHVPGDLHLDPRCTTEDLVALVGRLRQGVERPRVDALLERFGLDPTRPIRELSSGNRRKIGLVLAFMHRPRLVLLDEPTAGLDPLLQQQFLDLVHEEVADGVTVLLSSHVLHEVEALADRVGILRQGELVAVATIDDLRAMAVQRVEMVLEGDVPLDSFGTLPGVVSVGPRPAPPGATGIDLRVQGGIDGVVKHAALHTVRSFATHDDDLDEVFMSYFAGSERT